jgi:hypothetical protein
MFTWLRRLICRHDFSEIVERVPRFGCKGRVDFTMLRCSKCGKMVWDVK